MQCNVKAIIGWKSTENGDPLMDVAYFLAMFLQPANYGYEYLQDLDQLMGKCFTSPYGCILLVIICANKVKGYIYPTVLLQATLTGTPHQRTRCWKRIALRPNFMAFRLVGKHSAMQRQSLAYA